MEACRSREELEEEIAILRRRLQDAPRRVRVLEAEGADGRAVFRWDGRSVAGRELPSGTYLARLMSGEAVVATGGVALSPGNHS